MVTSPLLWLGEAQACHVAGPFLFEDDDDVVENVGCGGGQVEVFVLVCVVAGRCAGEDVLGLEGVAVVDEQVAEVACGIDLALADDRGCERNVEEVSFREH